MATKITVIVEVETVESVTTKTIIQILTGTVVIRSEITAKYTVHVYDSFDLFTTGMTTENLDWKKDHDILIIRKNA